MSIYPAVKFQMCSLNTLQVIARFIYFLNIFTVSVSIATIFCLLINKKSDVHYLLNGIYPAVKFQMCSFNTFRVIAGSRFFYIFTVSFP